MTDGPFTEAKEVVGGYAQFEFEVEARSDRIARCAFMELHKKHWPGWEGETEIRQIVRAGRLHSPTVARGV